VTFVLVGFHRKAVSIRSGAVTANAVTIGPSEEFDLLDRGGGSLAIRTLHGTFLTAHADGTVGMSRGPEQPGARFRLVAANAGRLGLLTESEHFLSASPEGKLEADRTWLRDWEEFYVYRLPNVDEFAPVSQRAEGSLYADAIFAECVSMPGAPARDVLAVVGGMLSQPPLPR